MKPCEYGRGIYGSSRKHACSAARVLGSMYCARHRDEALQRAAQVAPRFDPSLRWPGVIWTPGRWRK